MDVADLVPPLDAGSDRIARSPSWEMGDQLRWTAANLAYRVAKDYEEALRRIESHLAAATNKDGRFSKAVGDVALDVIRTHMIRGLLQAQQEAGDRLTFWVHR
mgnify:CR=1 FL=1